MGFRNMLLGYRDADRGHIIENIVFLELIRRDYLVYIGKVGETEVDFVAEKPNEKIIYSSNREYVITRNKRAWIETFTYDIKSLNLLDWLLS